jgi:hypothetical protein
MSVRVMVVIAIVSACGSHVPQPKHAWETCLAPSDAIAAAAHADDAWGELAKTKVGPLDLYNVQLDLVAIHRAAVIGRPLPTLTYGECLPDDLSLDVVFTGDDKPIQALTPEGIYATDPAAQTGWREAVAHFPTRNLVALVLLPNVRSISIPDPGHAILSSLP